MTIFINQAEYIAALSETPGIRLAVHRQDHFPFVEDDGIDVGVGQKTQIKIGSVSCMRFKRGLVSNSVAMFLL